MMAERVMGVIHPAEGVVEVQMREGVEEEAPKMVAEAEVQRTVAAVAAVRRMEVAEEEAPTTVETEAEVGMEEGEALRMVAVAGEACYSEAAG